MKRGALVLRPEPGAGRTVAALAARGVAALACPLFEVRACAWEMPDLSRFDAVVLTSANAVRHGGDGLATLRGMPVYAVGGATAAAATAAGLSVVDVGDDDAIALVNRLAAAGVGRVLHLAGRDHRTVSHPAANIEHCIIYEAVETHVPQHFRQLLAENPVILLHSPRAAARLADLVPKGRDALSLIAISDNCAAAAGTGWQDVAIAAKKRDDAMIDLADSLCGANSG
jgi:uroporphyrinogen-III synthase